MQSGGRRNILGPTEPIFGERAYGPHQPRIVEIPVFESGLPVIDMALWTGEPPAREYAWGTWLPLKQTTLLTGQGGIGKSLLTQQLLTAIAMGLPFMGLETRKMRTLYWTCEDDPDELWRRQEAINRTFNIDMEDVAGNLSLVSLCGEADTSLAVFDNQLRMQTTDSWGQLRDAIYGLEIGVYAVDNVTDAMAGDMNDVHQVAQFVNLLTGSVVKTGGAALLLHHPNKNGDDWLGSVAWHNKVRSRLLLNRPDNEADMDLRVLSSAKANYGPLGGEIALRWYAGAFVRDDDLPEGARSSLRETTKAAGDNALFMACLAARTLQQRAVSEKKSPAYAPSVFASMSEAKGASKKRMEAAMDRLFTLGRIERAELWRGPDRKPVYGLREVAGNGAGNTVRGTEFSSPQPAETLAGNAGNGAGNTYPSLREGGEPPLEGAPSPLGEDDDGFMPSDWED